MTESTLGVSSFLDDPYEDPPKLADLMITAGTGDRYLIQYQNKVDGLLLIDSENTGREEIQLPMGTGLVPIEISRATGKTMVSFLGTKGAECRLLYQSELLSPIDKTPKISLGALSKAAQVGVPVRFLYKLENRELIKQATLTFTSANGLNLGSYDLLDEPLSSGFFDVVFPEVGKGTASAVIVPNLNGLEIQSYELELEIHPNPTLSLEIWWENEVARILGWKSKGYSELVLMVGAKELQLHYSEGYIYSFPRVKVGLSLVGKTSWGQMDTVQVFSELDRFIQV